jgi:hypothetical protein
VAAAFVFRGTDALGQLSTAKFVVEASGSAEVDAKIYDATNSNDIAEITGATGPVAIETDSSLTGLPTGEALFYVQLKRRSGSGAQEARIYSAMLAY